MAGNADSEDAEGEVGKKETSKSTEGVEAKWDRTMGRVWQFTIMDVVEDGCRVRALNVWAFLLIYVFFVVAGMTLVKKTAPQVSVVDFSASPPQSMLIGRRQDQQSEQAGATRRMKAKVSNEDGSPATGKEVRLRVTEFIPNGVLPCGDTARAVINGTLEAIRHADVCRYSVNGSGTTDRLGVTSIDSFDVEGPTGYYTVGLVGGNQYSDSDYTTVLSTPVREIEVINPATRAPLAVPSYAQVGQPLAQQPAVMLRDAAGAPLSGRTVICFANPDPIWPPASRAHPVPSYHRYGQKIARLMGAVSEPSDGDGIARFSGLGVESSTSEIVHLVFSADGFVFVPWGDPTYSVNNLYPFPPEVYRPPTLLLTPVKAVSVESPRSDLPITVREGEGFSATVRAVDGDGNGVEGRTCFVLIAAESGRDLVYLFRRQVDGSVKKELLGAESAPTDASGVARFTNISFSRYGNTIDDSGAYRRITDSSFALRFVCDGHYSREVNVSSVSSRVHEVRIQRIIRNFGYVSKYFVSGADDGSDTFVAVVRVVDSAGRGVQGKSINVKALGTDGEFSSAGAPIVFLVERSQEPTSEEGFSVVTFRTVSAPSSIRAPPYRLQFRVRFFVDGVLSDVSEDLTVALRGSARESQCHLVGFVSFYVQGGEGYDLFETRPTLVSGQTAYVALVFWGASEDQRANFSASRRLSSADLGRRVEEVSAGGGLKGLKRSRRLTIEDGRLELEIDQAYSTKGERYCSSPEDCNITVPYEPGLTEARFVEEPSLQQLNQNGFIGGLIQFQGSPGTHFVRIKATFHAPGAAPSPCYSPPVEIQINNNLTEIEVSASSNNARWDEPILFTLRVHGARNLSAPSMLYLSEDLYEDGALYFRFLQVPRYWTREFFYNATAEGMVGALHSSMYNLTQTGPYEVGTDGMGTMPVLLELKLPGLFGDFAIQFGSAGIFSDPYPFDISEPPGLALEVLQPPGLGGAAQTRTQMVLPVQPIVRVLSNGVPLDGAKVFAEPVARYGGKYEKLTEYEGYDATGLMYSQPSGHDGAGPGIAVFLALNLFDGQGCFQFRFHLGARGYVPEGEYPQECLEFVPAVTYTLATDTPASLPLDQALEDVKGTNATFKVNMEYGGGSTHLLDGGLAVARISVAKKRTADGEQALPADIAAVTTRTLLENFVCLWVDGKEYNGQCGDLETVQTEPHPIMSFEVKKLTWKRVTEFPMSISLLPSDLSMTVYDTQGGLAQMPAGMPSLSEEEKAAECMMAVAEQPPYFFPLPASPMILPELKPASGRIELAPPSVVEVGQMFLVRVQVLTKSGGPVKDAMLRVAIVPSLALDARSVDEAQLQQLGAFGNTLRSFVQPNVALDPRGVLRRSDYVGRVSFPLSIARARSGTYSLKFQLEDPSASILLTSPAFIVVNGIAKVEAAADDSWDEMEVEKFGESVRIPRQPRFRVTAPGGSSLEELDQMGITVRVQLVLKGVSVKVVKKIDELKRYSETVAQEAARGAAAGFQQGFDDAVAKMEKLNPFSKLAPDFQAECRGTRMLALEAEANQTLVRDPSVTDAVSADTDTIDPTEMLSQFVRTITGAGGQMATSAMMKLQLKRELGIRDLRLVENSTVDGTFVGTYEVAAPIDFSFSEGYQYAWEVSVNGVASDSQAFRAFKAVPEKPSLVKNVLNWLVSALAAILGVVVLTTNTTKHHWFWFVVAIPVVIGVMCYVPFMDDSKRALDDKWAFVAYANLVLILICLVWGLFVELRGKKERLARLPFLGIPFAEKRIQVFEAYTTRRMLRLISHNYDEVDPGLQPLLVQLKQMIRPLNADTAFFFPSQLWVGFVLSLFSYFYVLMRTLQVVDDVNSGVDSMLNRAIDAVLGLSRQVQASYLSATSADLPDSATEFIYKQLGLIRDWFDGLKDGVFVGMVIGTVLAAIMTVVGLLLTFFAFRRSVLLARRGTYTFQKKEAQPFYDSMFMGQFIASTIVGFITIVVISVVCALPFTWDIPWKILWSYRNTILWVFIAPRVFQLLQNFLIQKCLFLPSAIRNRALASIFMFWQTWLSIVAGITAAIVRFALAVVGLIVSMPQLFEPATPPILNKVKLLDSAHRTYLGAVMTFHCHNHPIVIFAADSFLELGRTRKKLLADGVSPEKVQEDSRRKSKRWLLLLLMVHPWLKQHRKSALEGRREEEAQAKARAKTLPAPDQAGKKPSAGERELRAEILRLDVEADHAKQGALSLRETLAKLKTLEEGSAEAKSLVRDALGQVPGRASK